MKKIILPFFLIFIVVFIYVLFKNNNLYYLDIGSNVFSYNKFIVDNYIVDKYNFSFTKNDYRITDLINMIDNNYNYIKHELVSADLITINIGLNDVIYYSSIGIDYYEDFTRDYLLLFESLRNVTKEKIVLVGLFNYDCSNNIELKKINDYLKVNTKQYDIIYLDVFNIFNNSSYLNCNNHFISPDANIYIAKKIMENI